MTTLASPRGGFLFYTEGYMELQAWGSILLILLIGFWLIKPVKSTNQTKPNQRSVVATKPVYANIMGVTIRSNLTSVGLLGIKGQNFIKFANDPLHRNAETVYVLVAKDGSISQYLNELTALKQFNNGDYGVVAITRSPNALQQRTIKPGLDNPLGPIAIEFSLELSTK